MTAAMIKTETLEAIIALRDGRDPCSYEELNDAYWALHDDPGFSVAIEY